jgi:hypothetical protein
MFKRGLSGGPGVRSDRVRCFLVPSRPTAPHASYCGMRIRQALHSRQDKGSIVDVVGCGDEEERASRLGDALGGALGLSHTVGH